MDPISRSTMPFCHGLPGAVMTCWTLRLASFSFAALPVHSIAIMDEVTRGIPIGNRLNQLLSNPFRCGVLGDVEMQNFPPPVSENNEDEENLETKRRHGKEINSHDLTYVVV